MKTYDKCPVCENDLIKSRHGKACTADETHYAILYKGEQIQSDCFFGGDLMRNFEEPGIYIARTSAEHPNLVLYENIS